MKFEIDDEEFDPQNEVPPIIAKMLGVLQSMPDGKLYTTRRLAQEIGHSTDTTNNYATHVALNEYRIKATTRGVRRRLFGNAATIKAYREQLNV